MQESKKERFGNEEPTATINSASSNGSSSPDSPKKSLTPDSLSISRPADTSSSTSSSEESDEESSSNHSKQQPLAIPSYSLSSQHSVNSVPPVHSAPHNPSHPEMITITSQELRPLMAISDEEDINAFGEPASPIPILTDLYEYLKFLGSLVFHGSNIIEEGIESALVIYAVYLNLANNEEKLRTPDYFPLMAAAAFMGVITKTLHATGLMSEHSYHTFREVMEAIAGAAIIGIYIADFINEGLAAVVAGCIALFVFATIKSLIEVYKEKPLLQTRAGKLIATALGTFFNMVEGAAITDALFAICEGFYAPVSGGIRYSVTALLCLVCLLATYVINKQSQAGHKNLPYKFALGYLAFLYAADIDLFLTILIFDIIVTARNTTDLKDWMFYSVVFSCIAIGVVAMIKKFILNLKGNGHEHGEHSGHGHEAGHGHGEHSGHGDREADHEAIHHHTDHDAEHEELHSHSDYHDEATVALHEHSDDHQNEEEPLLGDVLSEEEKTLCPSLQWSQNSFWGSNLIERTKVTFLSALGFRNKDNKNDYDTSHSNDSDSLHL